jgi:ATP-dependent RNA/DNA helicase IGHMBP2
MELPVTPSDDVIERLTQIRLDEDAESAPSRSETSSQSGKSENEIIAKWIEKKTLFIQLERQEDAEQTEQALSLLPMKDLESKGIALRSLVVEDTRTGLWGRQIMTLARSGSGELPSHRFSPGDIVCLRTKSSAQQSDKDAMSVRGLIYKISNDKIQVALSDKPFSVSAISKQSAVATTSQQEENYNDAFNVNFNGKIVTMVLVGNDTTFKRMEVGLKHLASQHASNALSSGLKVLFGFEKPDPVPLTRYLPLSPQFTSSNMNQSQLEAISGALSSNQLFLIHGPPGTGKTTVLIEYILQAVKIGQRLLVCAPSNVAVDNIVERLAPFTKRGGIQKSSQASSSSSSSSSTSSELKIVRIGHPARVQTVALQFSVEEQYRQSNGYEVVSSLEEDMDRVAKEVSRTSTPAARRQLKKDWLAMKRDLKKVASTAMKQVVQNANVVLATCTGADDRLLRDVPNFDVVIVDEAAQALDPIILLPLLRGKKIVLAGDHLQLPPTIKSTKAIEKDLCTTTFFERCIRRFPSISRLLSVQYRMNDLIMSYSSSALYRGKLTADDTVKAHRLDDLLIKRDLLPASSDASSAQSASTEYLTNPLILVDTAGCSFEESGGANESKWNEGEANVVVSLVRKLLASNLAPQDIGIIAPYNAQVDLLRSKLRPEVGHELEISSVDSFQGREKECIIYTLVRSNAHRNVGFLSSDQRTNVAITRAKRLLIIVADTETLGAHKFLKRLFGFCESHGQYWSAAEFETTYEAVDHKVYGKKSQREKPKTQTSSNNRSKSEQKDIPSSSVASVVESQQKPSKSTEDNPLAEDSKATPSQENSSKETDNPVSEALTSLPEPALSTANRFEDLVEGETSSSAPTEVSTAEIKLPPASEISSSPKISSAPKKTDQRLVTKPPQDYREMQKAKFESQKMSSSSPSSSSTNEFGVSTSYIPTLSTHPSNKIAGAKVKPANASSSAKKPEAIKSSLYKLDDDAFLDSLIKESETCYTKGCKESMKLLGEMCKYCKHMYCLKHFGAEMHGCGEEAKREGREKAKKKGVELRAKAAAHPVIDGTPRMKDWQKSVIADKLAKKVEAKKEERSKKPNAKK